MSPEHKSEIAVEELPRAVHMAHAAANLVVAIDALSRASVALTGRADGEHDPEAWDLARQLDGLRDQVNAAWNAASEMVWRKGRSV